MRARGSVWFLTRLGLHELVNNPGAIDKSGSDAEIVVTSW